MKTLSYARLILGITALCGVTWKLNAATLQSVSVAENNKRKLIARTWLHFLSNSSPYTHISRWTSLFSGSDFVHYCGHQNSNVIYLRSHNWGPGLISSSSAQSMHKAVFPGIVQLSQFIAVCLYVPHKTHYLQKSCSYSLHSLVFKTSSVLNRLDFTQCGKHSCENWVSVDMIGSLCRFCTFVSCTSSSQIHILPHPKLIMSNSYLGTGKATEVWN